MVEQVKRVLGIDLLQQLLFDFPAFKPERARDDCWSVNGRAVHTRVRSIGIACQGLESIVLSQKSIDLVSRTTGIPFLLCGPDYSRGFTDKT